MLLKNNGKKNPDFISLLKNFQVQVISECLGFTILCPAVQSDFVQFEVSQSAWC